MRVRFTPAVVAVGSLVALGLLAAALYRGRPADTAGPAGPPLIAYVAASGRPPMEVIAREYEAATGRRVELRFGASEDILTRAALPDLPEPPDLFLPADESYIQTARAKGLVAETYPVATMRAVVLTPPGNPKGVAGWAELVRDGAKVAVPGPAAAVGRLTRDRLAADGRWAALEPRAVATGTVTEAANAAKLGSVDAAVVWDAVAANYPGQTVLPIPELAGVVARVEVAVLTGSRDPAAARRLARYVAASDRGLAHFKATGFRVVEGASAWSG